MICRDVAMLFGPVYCAEWSQAAKWCRDVYTQRDILAAQISKYAWALHFVFVQFCPSLDTNRNV